MMGVLHRDRFGLEPIPSSQDSNLLGIVVGHQKVSLELPANREQAIVINLPMSIETGSRISPEFLPRIFEPFLTTKNAGATRGTGLGLSMVYTLTLAQHEGFGLRVESELGKGTMFSIMIPVRNASN